MPDPATRDVPKGQAQGAVKEQQQFLSEAPAQGESLPPLQELGASTAPDEGLDIEGFGNIEDLVFGPTDVPEEDPNTPLKPVAQGPFSPSPNNFRILSDPRVSEQMKGMLSLAIISDILSRGQPLR